MSDASLELTAAIERIRPLRAESIRVDVELHNRGQATVTIPVLAMNNGALALVVRDADGAEIGSYTWADASRRLQEIKFDPDEASLHDLRPGEVDGLTRDLMLLREPLEPGTYAVSARLKWKGIHVESAAVEIEVLPSRPRAFAVASDGDALGPWHLHTAWVDSIDGAPWLVQGSTFGSTPGVMHHIDRAFALRDVPADGSLHLSRSTGPAADHRATLVRIADAKLQWSLLGPALLATEHALPISAGERVCGTPWRRGDATFVMLASGDAPEVRAIRLGDDGSSTVVGTARTASTPHRELVLDSTGTAWCIALANEGTGSALWQCSFDGSAPTARLRARTHGVALCVTHGHARAPIAAAVLEDDAPAWMVSWALRGDTLGEKVEGPRLPRGRADERWNFAIGVNGGLHGILHRTHASPLYADPFGEVGEHVQLADLRGDVRFIAGRRGDPFVGVVSADEGVVLRSLASPAAAGVAGVHQH